MIIIGHIIAVIVIFNLGFLTAAILSANGDDEKKEKRKK